MKLTPIVCLFASAFVMTACGDRPPEKKATQVVAKVNGGEVSVHQLNFVLQRAPNVPADKVDEVKRQVLESLIDQELAVQKATEEKLERTPNVMQALESAKREILSRAYLEQQVSKVGKPSQEDVAQYYKGHPELFAERKIYRLEEVTFAATPEVLESAKQQIAQAKPVSEITAGLRAKGVEVAGGVVVKPAEQLSLELLPRLSQARDGQPMLIENGGKAAIVTVLNTKLEPIDQAKAQPFIEGFLINKQKTDLARQAMKQLRDQAKIEYVGEFAGNKPAAPAPVENAPAKPVANATDNAVSKGIAGLK